MPAELLGGACAGHRPAIKFFRVCTINAILEPDAEGNLQVPLPEELRRGWVRIVATLEAAESVSSEADAQVRIEAALAALGRLRELGAFREITDPAAWQREIRQDRPLTGRAEE